MNIVSMFYNSNVAIFDYHTARFMLLINGYKNYHMILNKSTYIFHAIRHDTIIIITPISLKYSRNIEVKFGHKACMANLYVPCLGHCAQPREAFYYKCVKPTT